MSQQPEKPWDQGNSAEENWQTPEEASIELTLPDGEYNAWRTVAGEYWHRSRAAGFECILHVPELL